MTMARNKRALASLALGSLMLAPVLLAGCMNAQTKLSKEEESAIRGVPPPGGGPRIPLEAQREMAKRAQMAAEAMKNNPGGKGPAAPAGTGGPAVPASK